METRLDKFGRVVIPKEIRDNLGLRPGERLVIEERDNNIILKPINGESPLYVKESVVVYSGKATDDIDKAVRAHRRERLKKVTRRGGK